MPLKRNIGKTTAKMGRLKVSIVGQTAVKHIPIAANIRPDRNEKGSTSNASGNFSRPSAAMTTIIRAATKTDFVAWFIGSTSGSHAGPSGSVRDLTVT